MRVYREFQRGGQVWIVLFKGNLTVMVYQIHKVLKLEWERKSVACLLMEDLDVLEGLKAGDAQINKPTESHSSMVCN